MLCSDWLKSDTPPVLFFAMTPVGHMVRKYEIT